MLNEYNALNTWFVLKAHNRIVAREWMNQITAAQVLCPFDLLTLFLIFPLPFLQQFYQDAVDKKTQNWKIVESLRSERILNGIDTLESLSQSLWSIHSLTNQGRLNSLCSSSESLHSKRASTPSLGGDHAPLTATASDSISVNTSKILRMRSNFKSVDLTGTRPFHYHGNGLHLERTTSVGGLHERSVGGLCETVSESGLLNNAQCAPVSLSLSEEMEGGEFPADSKGKSEKNPTGTKVVPPELVQLRRSPFSDDSGTEGSDTNIEESLAKSMAAPSDEDSPPDKQGHKQRRLSSKGLGHLAYFRKKASDLQDYRSRSGSFQEPAKYAKYTYLSLSFPDTSHPLISIQSRSPSPKSGGTVMPLILESECPRTAESKEEEEKQASKRSSKMELLNVDVRRSKRNKPKRHSVGSFDGHSLQDLMPVSSQTPCHTAWLSSHTTDPVPSGLEGARSRSESCLCNPPQVQKSHFDVVYVKDANYKKPNVATVKEEEEMLANSNCLKLEEDLASESDSKNDFILRLSDSVSDDVDTPLKSSSKSKVMFSELTEVHSFFQESESEVDSKPGSPIKRLRSQGTKEEGDSEVDSNPSSPRKHFQQAIPSELKPTADIPEKLIPTELKPTADIPEKLIPTELKPTADIPEKLIPTSECETSSTLNAAPVESDEREVAQIMAEKCTDETSRNITPRETETSKPDTVEDTLKELTQSNTASNGTRLLNVGSTKHSQAGSPKLTSTRRYSRPNPSMNDASNMPRRPSRSAEDQVDSQALQLPSQSLSSKKSSKIPSPSTKNSPGLSGRKPLSTPNKVSPSLIRRSQLLRVEDNLTESLHSPPWKEATTSTNSSEEVALRPPLPDKHSHSIPSHHSNNTLTEESEGTRSLQAQQTSKEEQSETGDNNSQEIVIELDHDVKLTNTSTEAKSTRHSVTSPTTSSQRSPAAEHSGSKSSAAHKSNGGLFYTLPRKAKPKKEKPKLTHITKSVRELSRMFEDPANPQSPAKPASAAASEDAHLDSTQHNVSASSNGKPAASTAHNPLKRVAGSKPESVTTTKSGADVPNKKALQVRRKESVSKIPSPCSSPRVQERRRSRVSSTSNSESTKQRPHSQQGTHDTPKPTPTTASQTLSSIPESSGRGISKSPVLRGQHQKHGTSGPVTKPKPGKKESLTRTRPRSTKQNGLNPATAKLQTIDVLRGNSNCSNNVDSTSESTSSLAARGVYPQSRGPHNMAPPPATKSDGPQQHSNMSPPPATKSDGPQQHSNMSPAAATIFRPRRLFTENGFDQCARFYSTRVHGKLKHHQNFSKSTTISKPSDANKASKNTRPRGTLFRSPREWLNFGSSLPHTAQHPAAL